ncbi:MAG: phage tail tape measure protein [Bacteroidales bacterium]
MLDLGTLRIGVTVDEQGASGKLSMLKTSVVGIGAATAALGVAAVKSFGDFEQSLNKVATIADLNVKSIDDIKTEVLALSSSMGIAGEDINEAMYQAISATGDTANALTYVEQAAKLAKGGFTETASAMDAVTKTMNAYGQSGEEAFGKISDLLVQTQNQGITTVNELSGALYNVVPTAAALGVSFEDVSASLATMTAQGTPTSVATTQLRSAMNELSKSGTKASDAFKKVAGEGFAEFMASGGNMSEAMKIMEEAAAKNKVSLTDMFSSVEAGAAALALTGSGADKYNTSLEAMQNSAGATEAAYKTMSEGINASFDKIMTALKNVMIELGDKLAPLVNSLADWIIENMPVIQSVITLAFDTIGAVIEVCVECIETFMDWLDDLLKSNSETGEGINEVWESVRDVFEVCFEKIEGLISAFVGWATRIWDEYGEEITAITQTLWTLIKEVFETSFNIIMGLIDVFTAFFEGDFEGMKDAVIKLCDTMWQGIKDLFKKGIDFIGNLVPTMFQMGVDLVTGLWNGWKSIWSGMVAWVKDSCSNLLGGIKDFFQIKSPSRVMKEVGKNIGEGMQIGIEDSGKGVVNATKQLTTEVLDLVRYYSLEYENTMTKSQQKVYDMRKESVKNYIADQKYFNMLSLEEEMDFYKGMYELAKGNGEEMIYWEKEMYRVKQEMRKEDIENLKEANAKYRELYMEQVTNANEILTANSNEEIKHLQDQLDKMDAEDKQNAYDEKYKRFEEQIRELEKSLGGATWEERKKINKDIETKQKEFDDWLYDEERKKQRQELNAQIKEEQKALKQKIDNNNNYAKNHLNIVDKKLKDTIDMIESGNGKEISVEKTKQSIISGVNQEILSDTVSMLNDKERTQDQSNRNTLSSTSSFARDLYTENYRVGTALANGIADGILDRSWRVTKALKMLAKDMSEIMEKTVNNVSVDYGKSFEKVGIGGYTVIGARSQNTQTVNITVNASVRNQNDIDAISRRLQNDFNRYNRALGLI